MKIMYKNRISLSVLLILVLLLSACAAAEVPPGQSGEGAATDEGQPLIATDYSLKEHWLSLPEKVEKEVDVFYLYPTAWSKESEDEPNLCEIDNQSMVAGSKAIFEAQATAFETTANIYAPYYRQLDAAYTLGLPYQEQDAQLRRGPYVDAEAAFTYYVEQYNEGRPFLLAGHSQGSDTLLFLLSDYMKEHPDVYNRMVAAYVIGYSVTEEYMEANPHLKFAQDADDTGVIISYNTEAPGLSATNPVLRPHSLAINPISWTRDETPAPAGESLGSRVPLDGVLTDLPHFADAAIDLERGVVTCSTVDRDQWSGGSDIFPKGIYHGQDYAFYYYDIRANAENRVNRFLQ